jgi:ribosomal protein S18 acetylase RimI-like enzyme
MESLRDENPSNSPLNVYHCFAQIVPQVTLFMAMRWFRRGLDLKHATIRLTNQYDINGVSRLLRDAIRRYYGFGGNELPSLVAESHAAVIESGNEMWGVAIASFYAQRTSWLRGVALIRGLDVKPGMQALLPPLHRFLHYQGINRIYYAGDENADTWLLPALTDYGYVQDTEVVVYEKRNMNVPSRGNSMVQIRPVCSTDQAIIHALDRACFEVQWRKDAATLNAAIVQDTFFVVAELDSSVVGYAYATSHFAGKLVHLVRIAVDPRHQGKEVGVRLLAEVVGSARRQHAQILTLNTQSYNEQAQRLYRWFGFVATGEHQLVLRYDLGRRDG